MSPLFSAFFAAAFAAAMALAPPALAQSAAPADDTANRAAAQTLFDDAMILIAQKKYDLACNKLEEVVKLQPGKIGALIELGECYVGAGKPASAWARLRMAATLAGKANDPRKTELDARFAQIEPQVSRITVIVPESLRWLGGLVVEKDGMPLGAATWGASMPSDPGVHEISASAPGKKKWSSKIEITRPGSNITVTIGTLEDAASTAGSGMSPLRTAGFAVGGLGLVGIVIGSVFGMQAAASRDEANKYCGADSCTTKGHGFEEAAWGNATASTASFVIGGVLLAGGVTMVLWPTGKPEAKSAPTARIVVGPGNLALQGVW